MQNVHYITLFKFQKIWPIDAVSFVCIWNLKLASWPYEECGGKHVTFVLEKELNA